MLEVLFKDMSNEQSVDVVKHLEEPSSSDVERIWGSSSIPTNCASRASVTSDPPNLSKSIDGNNDGIAVLHRESETSTNRWNKDAGVRGDPDAHSRGNPSSASVAIGLGYQHEAVDASVLPPSAQHDRDCDSHHRLPGKHNLAAVAAVASINESARQQDQPRRMAEIRLENRLLLSRTLGLPGCNFQQDPPFSRLPRKHRPTKEMLWNECQRRFGMYQVRLIRGARSQYPNARSTNTVLVNWLLAHPVNDPQEGYELVRGMSRLKEQIESDVGRSADSPIGDMTMEVDDNTTLQSVNTHKGKDADESRPISQFPHDPSNRLHPEALPAQKESDTASAEADAATMVKDDEGMRPIDSAVYPSSKRDDGWNEEMNAAASATASVQGSVSIGGNNSSLSTPSSSRFSERTGDSGNSNGERGADHVSRRPGERHDDDDVQQLDPQTLLARSLGLPGCDFRWGPFQRQPQRCTPTKAVLLQECERRFPTYRIHLSRTTRSFYPNKCSHKQALINWLLMHPIQDGQEIDDLVSQVDRLRSEIEADYGTRPSVQCDEQDTEEGSGVSSVAAVSLRARADEDVEATGVSNSVSIADQSSVGEAWTASTCSVAGLWPRSSHINECSGEREPVETSVVSSSTDASTRSGSESVCAAIICKNSAESLLAWSSAPTSSRHTRRFETMFKGEASIAQQRSWSLRQREQAEDMRNGNSVVTKTGKMVEPNKRQVAGVAPHEIIPMDLMVRAVGLPGCDRDPFRRFRSHGHPTKRHLLREKKGPFESPDLTESDPTSNPGDLTRKSVVVKWLLNHQIPTAHPEVLDILSQVELRTRLQSEMNPGQESPERDQWSSVKLNWIEENVSDDESIFGNSDNDPPLCGDVSPSQHGADKATKKRTRERSKGDSLDGNSDPADTAMEPPEAKRMTTHEVSDSAKEAADECFNVEIPRHKNDGDGKDVASLSSSLMKGSVATISDCPTASTGDQSTLTSSEGNSGLTASLGARVRGGGASLATLRENQIVNLPLVVSGERKRKRDDASMSALSGCRTNAFPTISLAMEDAESVATLEKEGRKVAANAGEENRTSIDGHGRSRAN